MAREEAEAGERRGDERLLRLLLGPGGCLLSSSFLFFFFCAPLARPAAAEVPEPRPQGGGQALDVKGGVGVDQEDGLAAGQGGGRGLGEVLHTQRERETETEKRLSFFVVCSCVCVWGGGGESKSMPSLQQPIDESSSSSPELSILTWTSSAVFPLPEGPTNSTACPGRNAGANQSPVRTGTGAERRK